MAIKHTLGFTALVSLFAFPSALWANEIRAEAGIFSTGYNRFAIPSATGTKVNFSDSGSGFYYRGSASFKVSENGLIRVMAAPLEANYSFTPDSALSFNNVSFPAGVKTDVEYQFNSFRAAYLYRFALSESLVAQLGGVAKIRVAKIALTNGATKSEYNNTGFVPLLNLGLHWIALPNWEIRFDVDGAAAKQGRAVDGSLELFHRLTEKGSGISVGYRLLEGGADNDKVYTFSLFHYAFLALHYGF